jgi:hypothetical protein
LNHSQDAVGNIVVMSLLALLAHPIKRLPCLRERYACRLGKFLFGESIPL